MARDGTTESTENVDMIAAEDERVNVDAVAVAALADLGVVLPLDDVDLDAKEPCKVGYGVTHIDLNPIRTLDILLSAPVQQVEGRSANNKPSVTGLKYQCCGASGQVA